MTHRYRHTVRNNETVARDDAIDGFDFVKEQATATIVSAALARGRVR